MAPSDYYKELQEGEQLNLDQLAYWQKKADLYKELAEEYKCLMLQYKALYQTMRIC